MYSKTEAHHLRQAFWTTFGQYMQPVPSAEGLPTNWINYKTGLRHVYFRLHADGKRARVAIEITHRDAGLRELYYEQFRELRPMLEDVTGETWTWEPAALDDHGQAIARISQELTPVNLFSRDDWPQLISFFKPRLLALDEFWSTGQYAFDELR
ncbi:DUF4268 domain-containing protein [Hymenobacter sp. B81]|uniref:DUF4268 domain-containing protein n=1 Tax=Hymenobacter sp. B81 TaxID=3344878 RepID=UPI0037DD494B